MLMVSVLCRLTLQNAEKRGGNEIWAMYYVTFNQLPLNKTIKSSQTIRNLGAFFDSNMSMAAHITNLSRTIMKL